MSKNTLTGRQLGDYRMEDMLGQGAMARVYRGLDVHLKRYTAVKVIDTPLRSNPKYVQRFQREAEAIARLDHPHIVALYHSGEAEGVLYMAMQYIEGASLDNILARYQADGLFIEPEEAARIAREVCEALDYAHGKGVIHRDVKPSNIMLDRKGTAYLADFGLALLEEVGTSGEIFGTPHYVAPEQAISSANAGPQSDLYAVGVILYEMFAGVPPFDAPDPMDVAIKHLSEPPPPPSDHRPEMGAALESVILKTLEKTPEARYPTGAALADALDQALQSAPLPVQPGPAAAGKRPTIPERVAMTIAENPLPPIPAEVVRPASLSARPTAPLPQTQTPAPKRRRLYMLGLLLVVAAAAAVAWASQRPAEPEANTLPAGAIDCPGAPPAQLAVGDVAATVTHGQIVYDAPGGASVISLMQDTPMHIEDGPVCAQDGTWWQIRTNTGIIGWIAENANDRYYLAACPPGAAGAYTVVCPSANPSRLPTGVDQLKAWTAAIVREAPDREAEYIDTLGPGEVVTVRNGPVCAGAMLWWEVQLPDSSISGWVAEAAGMQWRTIPEPWTSCGDR